MLHVVLFQPEIPPNTGNIIRLCANAGCRLHLIHPLGFGLGDARLRRAGLDYHERMSLTEHDSLAAFRAATARARLFAFSTRGSRFYHEVRWRDGDALLFGPETRGLPDEVLESIVPERRLRIPMRPGNRSINLSNSVAVAVYEAWRQNGFSNGPH
ncbi:MAG TPA: tRNA (uridine(34)/cytosine(34)/5-carboxymethylaminomethyluridine(34)-2'-O)-methyltransferase TrmL [Gammaproteobacteria bacterium]|nr:tRNA (uridine(34)/cytosine(34)/5-carboxymethylaminomethyluridine(34)-2'-O)-methyltransferase TrmL [Gammaproteobacteria bacterium]